MQFFSWLFSFFKSPESIDLYHPKERLIYTYFDGEKNRKVDPMPLYRKMKDKESQIDAEFVAIKAPPSKWTENAWPNYIKLLQGIFDVKDQKDGGLTELELHDLYFHFLHYCGNVKKNSPSSPTISAPTGDSQVTSEKDQPITSTSDCGLTEKEPSTTKQEQLPTDLQSHLDSLPQELNTTKQ